MQTNNEIRETDRAIQLVQRSIVEKEEGLKVAQSRLDERTRRRCVELCRDAAMHGSVILILDLLFLPISTIESGVS